MQRMFLFLGGAFPMIVSESPSSSESASLCTSEMSLFFDFCFVFFFSVRFCTTVRFIRSEKKKHKLFVKFLMINPGVIEKYIVNVTYVVNNNRLGCFVSKKQTRKITAEFHKVTPVKPFTDCLISCHTTLTWKKCKLIDTLSTIFLYISKKSRVSGNTSILGCGSKFRKVKF